MPEMPRKDWHAGATGMRELGVPTPPRRTGAVEFQRSLLTHVALPIVQHTLSAVPRREKSVREQAAVNYKPVGRERYSLNRLHPRGGIGQVWVARGRSKVSTRPG